MTEKLYDAVWAGAVPIYIGAPNVETGGYFRKECGIIGAASDFHYDDGGFLRFNATSIAAECVVVAVRVRVDLDGPVG